MADFSPAPTSDPQLVADATPPKGAKWTGATTILKLQSGIAWRQFLKPASFRGARFYVDTAVRESGQRIVNHEFPKRDVPYAETMGRRSRSFTVRGYCIVYPHDGDSPLQKKNYIIPRDALIRELETGGPADLQLPLLGVLKVVVERYRVTEEEKIGGYCVFDMSFTEYGQAPATGTRQSAAGVQYAADNLGDSTQTGVTNGIKAIDSNAATVSV